MSQVENKLDVHAAQTKTEVEGMLAVRINELVDARLQEALREKKRMLVNSKMPPTPVLIEDYNVAHAAQLGVEAGQTSGTDAAGSAVAGVARSGVLSPQHLPHASHA